ncbi:MAG TPA: photosynthetic reaction center subunit H [Pseudomonadales bacterium]|nr:photosynthetic reaction center subunit H [Pseudomonadales bacterium]
METTGAITGYIDVAQIVLYAFWIFFFTLVFWLHRESKREGYPLEPDTGVGRHKEGFPRVPAPKTFALPGGTSVTVPEDKPEPELKARRMVPSAGSPYVPEGDPMLAAVGPGAYANRAEVPDAMYDGTPRLQPLRLLTDFHVDSHDPDPRGMDIVGADGVSGGRVVDVWADRAEQILRYYEFEKTGGGRALVPVNFTQIPINPIGILQPGKKPKLIKVMSIKGAHFADVPTLANPDQVTLREEDRIMGYYGGGYLYADASRQEPLL